MRTQFVVVSLMVLLLNGAAAMFYPPAAWFFLIIIPLILLGSYDVLQKKHTLWRNYPVIGHARWWMEGIRPMMQQYFVESDLDGSPINRVFRSKVLPMI